MAGKSVLYITVPNLITEFKESMTINQLTAYKKKFINYDLSFLMSLDIFLLISKEESCYLIYYQ